MKTRYGCYVWRRSDNRVSAICPSFPNITIINSTSTTISQAWQELFDALMYVARTSKEQLPRALNHTESIQFMNRYFDKEGSPMYCEWKSLWLSHRKQIAPKRVITNDVSYTNNVQHCKSEFRYIVKLGGHIKGHPDKRQYSVPYERIELPPPQGTTTPAGEIVALEYDGKYISFIPPSGNDEWYFSDVSKVETHRDVTHLLFHLKEKTWCTPTVLGAVLTMLCSILEYREKCYIMHALDRGKQ